MNTENDKYLFAFVFIGCPALYILFRMLPILVFYLVPFLGSALLIGWIWTEGCHVKHVNYRRVAALMAGTILVLVLTVGFPHPMAMGQKGKILLESRLLYDAFNSFSAGRRWPDPNSKYSNGYFHDLLQMYQAPYPPR